MPSVPVCGICHTARPLQCLARGGLLLQVCQVCYCTEELQVLAAQLPQSSPLWDALSEGLQVLYLTAKTEIEEQAARRDASEGRSRGRQGKGGPSSQG